MDDYVVCYIYVCLFVCFSTIPEHAIQWAKVTSNSTIVLLATINWGWNH